MNEDVLKSKPCKHCKHGVGLHVVKISHQGRDDLACCRMDCSCMDYFPEPEVKPKK